MLSRICLQIGIYTVHVFAFYQICHGNLSSGQEKTAKAVTISQTLIEIPRKIENEIPLT